MYLPPIHNLPNFVWKKKSNLYTLDIGLYHIGLYIRRREPNFDRY